MTRTIVTPVACRGRPVELAADTRGRRRWRKQILPLGELELDGQKLRFDQKYLTGVAKAWKDRAVDHVPLQLATGRNEHNNDPELTRGVIDDVGLHRPGEAPGLYASVSTGERGSKLLEEFPEIGVSVRLIEDLENATQGRVYPWALQHVLATWDPRISGMAGWSEAPDTQGPDTATDLSRTGGRVIDLSRSTYAHLGRKGAQMATKDEIKTKLTDLLKEAATALTDSESEGDQLTDEELAELAQGFFGDLTEGDDDAPTDDGKGDQDEGKGDEPAPDDADTRQLVDAAARHQQALELANQRTDEALTQVYDLAAERDETNWTAERQRWIEQGLPPHVVDLSKPALLGKAKTIELSNGEHADAGAMVRDIFTGLVKVGGLVDLSRSVGTAHDGSDQTAENADVDRLAKDLLSGL